MKNNPAYVELTSQLDGHQQGNICRVADFGRVAGTLSAGDGIGGEQAETRCEGGP